MKTIGNLIDELRGLKKNYEGKEYDDNVFNDSYFDVILGTNDGADTDIHICEMQNEDASCVIKFYVEVDYKTNIIVDINMGSVDIFFDDDEFFDVDADDFYDEYIK